MSAELRAALEKTCREWGISEHYERDGIHRWRCEYEERYGPCGDFKEFIDDLVAAVEVSVWPHGPIKPPEHAHSYVWTTSGSSGDAHPPIGAPCLGCGHPYGQAEVTT